MIPSPVIGKVQLEPNFNYQNFLLKNSVKLCLRLSYIVQNSFHFDEIFHIKFKLPILVLYVTSGNFRKF